MALNRQSVIVKNPLDEARPPDQLPLLTSNFNTPLLTQHSQTTIPRLGAGIGAPPTDGNEIKRKRTRRLKDNRACLNCGTGFRPEGGSHVLCNICGLRAWGTKLAEEYKTLVSMITGPKL